MKKAILMPCGGRRSVCAASLGAIAALDGLEGVDVFIADTEDETLWSDEACQAALEIINARTKLHYIRTHRKSPAQNRLELYRDALGVLPDDTALLTLDDDAVLPHDFLLESEKNFAVAPAEWGYIAHYSMYVLSLNREVQAMNGSRNPADNTNSWMGEEDYNDRLQTSYSAPGMAIWFRADVLRPMISELVEMCSYYTAAEDGLTCAMVAADFPCFVSKAAWAYHYSSIKQSRTEKDTSRSEQSFCFAELSRRGKMVGKIKDFWLREMKKCGHTTNGVGFKK